MSPIQETEDAASLRLAWNNRHVRKDRVAFWFLLIFWIAWAPLTVFLTGEAFLFGNSADRAFFSIWGIFGWFGTLAIPYAFLARSWFEWLEISNQGISHGFAGLLAPKPKTIPLGSILELGLGHYQTDERESIVTLNIFRIGPSWRERETFGYWLAPEIKEQVFAAIEKFVEKKQIALKLKRYEV